MSSLARASSASGLADHILSERRLVDLLGGSDARRYGLVNRAPQDGSLIRIKRGAYLLDPQFRSEPAPPSDIPQGLMPGSYVSFESELAHRDWTPAPLYTPASFYL